METFPASDPIAVSEPLNRQPTPQTLASHVPRGSRGPAGPLAHP